MAAPGDDAGGEVEEAFAAQEVGQSLAVVDAAAMEIALAAGEQAEPFRAGGGLERELDPGEGLMEPGDGAREDSLAPHRPRGHAKPRGAP